MKQNKQALAKSLLSLLLCVAMLVSTTFAWFTDSVTSGLNTIAAGNLDVELYHSNAVIDDEKVTPNTKLFLDMNGNPILWEPGVVSYENLRVTNEGDLALIYQLAINTANENYIVDTGARLSQVLKVGVVEGGITATDRDGVVNSVAANNWTTLSSFLRSGSLQAGGEETWGVVIYWQPGDNDNNWNANNGKQLSSGDALSIDLGIKLTATQEQLELDSFGPDYDAGAKDDVFPSFGGGIASAPVNVANGYTTDEVTITIGNISATVPAGVKVAEGTSELTLSIKNLPSSSANIVLGEGEALRSLDVHIDGVAEDNTTPITVTLPEVAPVALNMGNYKVYHVEDATNEMTLVAADVAFSAHNQYKYDPATGDVVLYMATFSEVAVVAEPPAWKGGVDHTWYNASKTELTIANADQLWSFSQIVGGMAADIEQDSFSGKTVTLIADINLGDKESENNPNIIFYPIGYWNNEGTYERKPVADRTTAVDSALRNFCGTFDGNGHTIANFYHNTWEMKGDHNWYSAVTEQYYRDGMGLFGRLYKATVKNLTVKNFSADGEIATTGVIAAYAEGSHFENIAVFNCNPRVYNIGNGGIVGCVGWYAKEANLKTTFKNITVDNSNKISALWGSYDVPCGGIVGQYYTTSGQTSAGKPANGGIHFENCHVSAVMDVNNDVCGNYQYYAYRYAGMLIGSVSENVTVDGHVYPKMDGISAEGCTVHFGTWNDYYYCEFEKNGHPSYSGPDDYKFSRISHSDINFTDSNGNGVIDTKEERESVTGCKHEHTAAEDQQCVYLQFNNLVTGYGWGVTTKEVGDLDGVTILDRAVGDSVTKFEGKVTELSDNKAYKLSDIFSFVNNGVDLVPGAITVSIHNLDTSNPVTAKIEPDANWEDTTITFTGNGRVNITIQDYYFCTPTTIEVNVVGRQEEEKFDIVMNNGDFLHRVGNQNAVALGNLFATKSNVSIGKIAVTVENVSGNAGGAPSANSYDNLSSGTIQFSGTGAVKVTITDNDYCIPTVLYLEVVDATNATSATSATDKNIVLLQDAGFGSLTVSNGYTLYGNGFTLTCGSDSAALDMGYAFVTLSNGTLDNVQIVTPNFDYAVLYKSNMTESGNRSETTDKTRYYNVKSGVMVSGNSQILNSRISGARAAVNVSGGDCLIDNSRIEGGAVASLLVGSANSLTLRDVTLVQKPTASTYDSSKTLMGFSVLFVCDADGNAAPVTLEGSLVQNAWVNESDKQYVPSAGQSIISNVLSKTEYLHDINGNKSLNLGFAYMPESLTSKVNATTITDNRTNKNDIPYAYAEVSILSGKTYVYSYRNTNGTADSFKTESEYVPNKYGDIITVDYADTNENRVFGKVYGTDGWVYQLTVDLDQGAYTFDFSKLTVRKNGTVLNIDRSNTVSVEEGSIEYTLTLSDGSTIAFKLIGTATTKDKPQWSNDANGTNLSTSMNASWEAGVCVASKKGGTWHGAAPALQNVYVRYYSTEAKAYKVIHLADYTPNVTGKVNGSNTTCTITGPDFTLTLTGGQVHSSNNVYAIPVVCNNKLYFLPATSSGLVNSGNSARTVPVSYSFTDGFGNTLSGNHTWSVAEDQNNEYSYSDFCDGKLTQLTSSGGGGGCVTGDTLVTLADGSKKMVKDITSSDMLLVWDFYNGKYTKVPAALVINHGTGNWNVITMTFDDGTVVKAVSAHAFFDADANAFVMIEPNNAKDYIGRSFVKATNNGYTTTKLIDCTVTEQCTDSYSLVSTYHYNFIVEDMFSMTNLVPDLIVGLEIGENMTYDAETLRADIEKYGLYTYADFADYMTEAQFNAFSGAYLKISVGKGYITYEEIVELIRGFVNP